MAAMAKSAASVYNSPEKNKRAFRDNISTGGLGQCGRLTSIGGILLKAIATFQVQVSYLGFQLVLGVVHGGIVLAAFILMVNLNGSFVPLHSIFVGLGSAERGARNLRLRIEKVDMLKGSRHGAKV